MSVWGEICQLGGYGRSLKGADMVLEAPDQGNVWHRRSSIALVI